MRCRSCQRENREGARFCRGCGAELERRAGRSQQASRREAERAKAVESLARSRSDADLRRGLIASAAGAPL